MITEKHESSKFFQRCKPKANISKYKRSFSWGKRNNELQDLLSSIKVLHTDVTIVNLYGHLLLCGMKQKAIRQLCGKDRKIKSQIFCIKAVNDVKKFVDIEYQALFSRIYQKSASSILL